MYPSYLKLHHNRGLQKLAQKAIGMLKSCCLCPRKCGVNRLQDKLGFCKTGLMPKVCSFTPHHGEEPPISGKSGSGTIFFSRCNMHCAYCQNYEFSQADKGKEVEFEELAKFMLELQVSGCHNINLVSPTHIMPQILAALDIAASGGLHLPIVYNTGGYELPQIIKLLDGIVDIYMPDMRYSGEGMAVKYSSAPGYPEYNRKAVKEMHRQVGVAEFDNNGIIKKGLIIRHLVLPDNISGTGPIMKFLAQEISKDTYLSLMSQYRPYYKAPQYKEISRRITIEEYEKAKEIAESCGLHNGWTQDAGGLERFAGIHIKPTLKDDS